jgi:hypothetical protein
MLDRDGRPMFKELGEAGSLVCVEARYKYGDILPERRKVGVQLPLDPIQQGPQDLLASIEPIGFTREEAATLQPRDNTSDGAGCQSRRGG